MLTITNKSILAHEIIDISATGNTIPVCVGMDDQGMSIVMSKLYESPDGRHFVEYEHGFQEVTQTRGGKPFVSGYWLFAPNHFVHGAWRYERGKGYVRDGDMEEPIRSIA